MQISEFIGQISLKKQEQTLLTQKNSFFYVESGRVSLFVSKIDKNNNVIEQIPTNCNAESFFSLGIFREGSNNYVLSCIADEDSEIDVISFDETDDKATLEEFIQESIKDNIYDWLDRFALNFEENDSSINYLKLIY